MADLAKRCKELEEALKPFAAVANIMMPLGAREWDPGRPNREFIPGEWPRWGDFLRAADLLEKKP